ncbi:tyrosine phosphatase family protein [Bartonella sp. HY406]|uniref:tyrosine phosphatase family protein n=1 Tax=Bartonella sp. HY406 TaxID=2979331 RepID=UPI0021C7DF83|nr:tyrosine protein phosphatase [Bartonella sp. HY406]UXN02404.1 tyrosine protein phosphatase [Bartonella sp. HY406]
MNDNNPNSLDVNLTNTLIITPLSRLKSVIKQHKPSHMITLLSPNAVILRDKTIAPENHHVLFFNDINEPRPNLIAPQMQDVVAIIDAARNWHLAQGTYLGAALSPLLIHCQMGISRSTAAAYIIACALNESIDEESLAISLRQLSPSATPNARLIALADEYLNRKDKMVSAIKRIGRGADASEGAPFILPIKI